MTTVRACSLTYVRRGSRAVCERLGGPRYVLRDVPHTHWAHGLGAAADAWRAARPATRPSSPALRLLPGAAGAAQVPQPAATGKPAGWTCM